MSVFVNTYCLDALRSKRDHPSIQLYKNKEFVKWAKCQDASTSWTVLLLTAQRNPTAKGVSHSWQTEFMTHSPSVQFNECVSVKKMIYRAEGLVVLSRQLTVTDCRGVVGRGMQMIKTPFYVWANVDHIAHNTCFGFIQSDRSQRCGATDSPLLLLGTGVLKVTTHKWKTLIFSITWIQTPWM